MRPEDYCTSGLPVFYWFYPLFLFPSSLLSVIDQWFICAWSPSHWCLQFELHERDKRCDTFLFLIKHIYWGQLCAYHQPELWHQLLLLMVLHLKKKIWLLNKSTALIHCNYSNNNKKNPQVNRLKFSHLFVPPTPALPEGTPANVRFYILVLRAACRI